MRSLKSGAHELIPPDGGYAYVVNFGAVLMVTFTTVPISSFALIFGPFLSKFDDETSAVAIVTSVYGTVFYVTGLLAHLFLQRLSYRKVAFIGGLIYILGNFASIFATNLSYVIFSYGVIQGLGTGLIVPSVLSAVNKYFDRKKSLAIAVGQTISALINITYPGFTRILLEKYGFRGTQAIFTAIELHILLGALTLQPVEWHLKRKLKADDKDESEISLENDVPEKVFEVAYSSIPKKVESQHLLERDKNQVLALEDSKISKSLTSIASFGSTPYLDFKKKENRCNTEFSILKEGHYWNIAIGLSLSAISELNFMAILPIFLFGLGFNKNDVTLMMTTYFASDLAMRIIFSLLTAFCSFSSRHVFLANVLVTIIIRLVFSASTSFWPIIVLIALSGFSRCLIQVPMPVVITESYAKSFPAAFSFYMVITGVLSVINGAITSLVKYKTGSDVMVLHVLTAILLLCGIPWTVEIIYRYLKSKRKKPDVS